MGMYDVFVAAKNGQDARVLNAMGLDLHRRGMRKEGSKPNEGITQFRKTCEGGKP
ncbi:MAG TPA: hypothetical protein VK463_18730 [Desulfomonilaceae bacterium]|nr:hypothetical protein [Desulfomonilaceae bacterium]